MAVPTLAEIKPYLPLNEGTAAFDVMLQACLDTAVALAQVHCRRTFAAVTGLVELHNGNGSPVLWLRRPPITGMPGVELVDAGFVVQTLDPADYVVPAEDDNDVRLLHLLGRFPQGLYNVRVTYDGGWTTVPAPIVEALRILTLWRWHARMRDPAITSESTQGASQQRRAGMPADAAALLAPYVLSLSFTGQGMPVPLLAAEGLLA